MGSESKVFLMPLSTYVEHRTKMRICQFEMFNSEVDVSEDDWREYFLAALTADITDYAKLDKAARALEVDMRLNDTDSRIAWMMSGFHTILDTFNMESLLIEDQKNAVAYVTQALRPIPLKKAVWEELKKPMYKDTARKNIQLFLQWLKPRMYSMLFIEAHLQEEPDKNKNRAPGAPVPDRTGGGDRLNVPPRTTTPPAGALPLQLGGNQEPVRLPTWSGSALSVAIRRMECSSVPMPPKRKQRSFMNPTWVK